MTMQNSETSNPAATAVASGDLSGVLFVYSRKGNVQCLNTVDARAWKQILIADGWQHTATINPARWIESLCMGHSDPCDMIDELQYSTNAKDEGHEPTGTTDRTGGGSDQRIGRLPSVERGCTGKANLGRDYEKQAERLSAKHGKQYGVYRCPHCKGTHLTTKLDNADKYFEPLLYVCKPNDQAQRRPDTKL